MHVAVAVMVLWRGAVWFESSDRVDKGGRSGTGHRPAISWVALPPLTAPHAARPAPPPRRVTVPTVAPHRIERQTLALPLRITASAPPALPAPPVETDGGADVGGTTRGGGPDGSSLGPGSGGGTSDIFAGDIFGPTPSVAPRSPAGAPHDDHRQHDVQFWIRADGRVIKIEVRPPIKDWDYRRRFMKVMGDIVFGPVKTRDGRPIDYVYSIVVDP